MNEAVRYPDVTVELTEQDGNIFSIMGRVTKALRRSGVSGSEVDAFVTELTSSDSYDEALAVVMRWVNVE